MPVRQIGGPQINSQACFREVELIEIPNLNFRRYAYRAVPGMIKKFRPS